MKKLLYLLMSLLCFTDTQAQGIKFEQGLTWAQVKVKAKAENKYIFLDCFATWCVPCKTMDESVYPVKEVGDAFNEKFISVKVQMDRTEFDDPTIKKWYGDANTIQKNYTVTAFPTFLFFSPEGTPVHKETGTLNAEGFIMLSKDALNPERQYYSILKNFQPGKIDTSELKGLAISFQNADKILAEKLALDYLNRIPKSAYGKPDNLAFITRFANDSLILKIGIQYVSQLKHKQIAKKNNLDFIERLKNVPEIQLIAKKYIDGQPQKQLFTKENLAFLFTFTKTLKDRGFGVAYHEADRVDNTLGRKGFAQQMCDWVIFTTEISPLLSVEFQKKENYKEPDFATMQAEIAEKYNSDYANRNILNGKVKWFGFLKTKDNKYWPDYLKYRIQQVETLRSDTLSGMGPITINVDAWNIFLYSTNIAQLKTAIKWMTGIIARNPNVGPYMDTYANLLYKVGDKDAAIIWQKKAVSQSPSDKGILSNLDKMKNGEATWPLK